MRRLGILPLHVFWAMWTWCDIRLSCFEELTARKGCLGACMQDDLDLAITSREPGSELHTYMRLF